MKSLEARLKRADTMNRKAIKSLDGVVSELAERTKGTQSKEKARLTRGLNALEAKLEAHVSRARGTAQASVREALSTVAQPNADISTLEQALQTAHARLDAQDDEQRAGLAKLNAHLANLARAIDAQLKAQAEEQGQAVRALDARIDRVELDTAEALERIGDTIADFSDALAKRTDRSDTKTAERLADLAQETQSEFDGAQTHITARLEALEVIAASWDPTSTPIAANMDDPRVERMDDTLAKVQEELARVHAKLAAVQSNTYAAAQPQAQTPQAQVPQTLAPSNVVSLAQPNIPNPLNMMRADNPYAAPTPQPPVPHAPAPMPAPEPAMAEAPKAAAPDARESHVPVEFDPSAYVAASPSAPVADVLTPPQTLAPPQALAHPESPTATSARNYLGAPIAPEMMTKELPVPGLAGALATPPPVQQPPMASLGGHSLPTLETEDVLSAPAPVETYADPAYAEAPSEMVAERVTGAEPKRQRSLPKLPISASNLRVGAMATGVAVLGLFAAKSILGGGGEISPAPATQQSVSAPQSTLPASTQTSALGTLPAKPAAVPETILEPPQGQYAGQSAPDVDAAGLNTLEAAVAAGNPIAEFQLGLAKLQAGETVEAARLIRRAANRNQPAAQYRLAKLYESGTGVEKDLVTARELVKRAAQGGNRIAMHDLGIYYTSNAGGVEPDMATAAAWFEKAAQRGVVDSQFNIAMLSEGENGIAPDLEAAYFWYAVAARQGDQGAPGRLASVASRLSETARVRVQAKADAFVPTPVDEAANGVFTDTPWIQNKPTQNAAKIRQVREAQVLLSDLGFDIGGADGAAGPKTRAAVREFQKVNGLPESGEITPDLIDRLEVAAGA